MDSTNSTTSVSSNKNSDVETLPISNTQSSMDQSNDSATTISTSTTKPNSKKRKKRTNIPEPPAFFAKTASSRRSFTSIIAEKPAVAELQEKKDQEKEKVGELIRAQREVESSAVRQARYNIQRLARGDFSQCDENFSFISSEKLVRNTTALFFYKGDFCSAVSYQGAQLAKKSALGKRPDVSTRVAEHCFVESLPGSAAHQQQLDAYRAKLDKVHTRLEAVPVIPEVEFSSRELKRIVTQILKSDEPYTEFSLAKTIYSLGVFPEQTLNELRMAIVNLNMCTEHNRRVLRGKGKKEFFGAPKSTH